MRRKFYLLFFLLTAVLSLSVLAQKKRGRTRSRWTDTTGMADIQIARNKFWDSLPDPLGLTSDFENIFSPEERIRLDSIITDYEKKTTIEFCIVTLDTMRINRDRFGDLPAYIEKSWGIGKEKTENGIVICLSIGYRSIRIGTGKGIDDYLSEKETTQIIQKNILPDFMKGKYFDGTSKGLFAIIDILDKKMKGKSSASR